MQIILFLLEIISPNPPFDKLSNECSFNQTQNVVCIYSYIHVFMDVWTVYIYILQNKYISIYVFLFLCFIFFPHPVERSKLHYTSLLSRSSLCRPSILQCDHCERNLKKNRQLFHHQLYVIREKLPLSSSY